MRWLLARVGGMVVVLTILLLGVRLAWGVKKSPIAEVIPADSGRRSPTCWREICPGQTTLKQAESILKTNNTGLANIAPYGTNALCWGVLSTWGGCGSLPDNFSDDLVRVIKLEQAFSVTTQRSDWLNETFYLGDAVLAFGKPQSLGLCTFPTTDSQNQVRQGVIVTLIFAGNIELLAYNEEHPEEWRVDPKLRVYRIRYHLKDWIDDGVISRLRVWKGFSRGPGEPIECGL